MSITGRKRKLNERDALDTDAEESPSPSGDSADGDPAENAPVKSHAALRKEKKRALKHAKGDIVAEAEPKKAKAETEAPAQAPQVRQNSVWVGNLAYKTTQDSLRKFFDGVGEITRIHMPTKNAGQGGKKYNVQTDNMGFAYVDFTTPDAKTIAITLSENNLDGRKLLIKDGADFTGRPSAPAQAPQQSDGKPQTDAMVAPQPGHSKFAQKVLRSQKQPPAPTLFMGNLPFEIIAEDIRTMLDTHRNAKSSRKESVEEEERKPSQLTKWLKKIRLGTFEDSGKCKGWAFLDFMDLSEATAALTNPRNHKMNGRALKLEYASPDAVRRGGQLLSGKDAERPRKKPRVEASRNSQREHSQRHDPEDEETPQQENGNRAPQRERRERVGRDGKTRPRPGAALAMAKRENVAIVESEGQKIKF